MQSPKIEIRNIVKIPLYYSSNSLEKMPVDADFVSFSGFLDGKEHFAVLIGGVEKKTTQKLRIHSECITGDVFRSGYCDCGDQLRESIQSFAKNGGVLIYLRQEGRGIGLFSKLESYHLQQVKGLDTFAANEALGFAHDLRDFRIAAHMLRAMEISSVELLSNNPDKQSALEECGITVVKRIPTALHINSTNKKYLKAKAEKGHEFSLDPRLDVI